MDELGKSIPAAEGMVDAEQSGSSKRNNEFCLNCGTKLVDAFCQHCGQKDLPQRQTLGELWSNFISSFWSYEGKFLLTTRYLLTRPGFLAVEYTKGKRESYYHPARMYVFISFVFFLLFFSLTDKIKTTTISKDAINLTDDDKKVLKEAQTQSNLDSILAMKRMYQQSWRKTIFEFFLFSFAFFFCAILALSITAIAILMII